MNRPGWAPSPRKKLWRAALMRFQEGICAGCGCPFTDKPNGQPRGPKSPLLPTLDHVEPRSAKGANRAENLLLKHRRCNEERDNRPPTGCDRIWQLAVAARREAHLAALKLAARREAE